MLICYVDNMLLNVEIIRWFLYKLMKVCGRKDRNGEEKSPTSHAESIYTDALKEIFVRRTWVSSNWGT